MPDKEEIILGSGYLFAVEFTGAIPENAALETDDNRLGYISGGASVEYKPSFYSAKDDMGMVTKTVMTDEEATLKSGVCTWNGNRLAKLCSTARVTEDAVTHTRTVKIGGIKNDNGKKYAIRFKHATDNIRLTIVGQNQAGFTLTFAKDKETVIDAEFKALPLDSDGTLITYTEPYEAE